MKQQNKAYLFALLAIICWSTVATAFKLALTGMDFLHLLLIASGTTIVFLSILLLISNQLKACFAITTKELLHSALLGLLNPFLYYLVLLRAYEILPAQFAMSLNYIWPIALVLLSIPLLHQKISLKSVLCILLSFSGVVIIANKGSVSTLQIPDPVGVMLAVVSSLFWALFWIFNVRDQREEKAKLLLNFLFGFVYTIVAIALFSEFELPATKPFLAGIYIGLVECGIAYVWWLKALKLTITTDKIGNLVFLSPFGSLLFIYFILGESIYLSTMVGLILIISGIILQKIAQKSSLIE